MMSTAIDCAWGSRDYLAGSRDMKIAYRPIDYCAPKASIVHLTLIRLKREFVENQMDT